MKDIKDMSIDELKELQNDMYIKYNELCNLYDDCNYERKFKDNYELERKYKKLKKELSVLEMKMREIKKNIFLKYEPIAFNEKVDLRKETEKLEGVYLIFLHNTNICIGETKYKGYHQFGGDMSVFIDKQYRGHGYAYESLRLLSDLLQKNGIGDFWLAVEKKNIPSLKTIEKYGGQVVSDFGPDALLYECKALSIDLEESKIIK